MSNSDPNQERRFVNFIIGFLGTIVVNLMLWGVSSSTLLFSDGEFFVPIIVGVLLCEVTGAIVGITASQKAKFVFIGALSSMLLPLLIFGGCTYLFFNSW
jgi:hypothetical protein